MNDKLLRAFIEASGYEIEEVETSIDLYGKPEFHSDGLQKLSSCGVIGTQVTTDYKVTKRVKPPKFSENALLKEAIGRMGRNEKD